MFASAQKLKIKKLDCVDSDSLISVKKLDSHFLTVTVDFLDYKIQCFEELFIIFSKLNDCFLLVNEHLIINVRRITVIEIDGIVLLGKRHKLNADEIRMIIMKLNSLSFLSIKKDASLKFNFKTIFN